ncbi:FkbM family methyltransferase [Mesorhizobium marinum]|uniref:FkbM family methyltransferase n=1 Tax=Mesorhizobium marinum TaxID=3228790 RepID=A0ABV3QWC6_9HYPH
MTQGGGFRETLRRGERALRDIRDNLIVKPLMNSRPFRRHLQAEAYAIVVDCADHRLAFDPSDLVIGATIRNSGGWFRESTQRVFDALPTRGKTFIDVGANIGTQTVYALMFGGFERAVCFEPHPKNAALLRANLALNNLTDRATVVEAAAGAAQGRATLSVSGHNGGGHSLAYERGLQTIEVDVVTVESVLAGMGLDRSALGLAWIDVEGFEAEVLAGWPSLPDLPLMVERRPLLANFPIDMLSGYRRWARIGDGEPEWRTIPTLNPADYRDEVDLLFA